ncbi:MAG: cob(I)yrinic acid a,c-diamide adenosyltransferase [Candidatus Woykebacteria bacterium]
MTKKTERKVRIYTKSGDKGETSLIFGSRVSKDDPRVKAYGAIDELNASLGLARSFTRDGKISRLLQNIQNELFNIGAELASPKKLKKKTNNYYHLEQGETYKLESIIDQYDKKLHTLRSFILPGGTKTASALHLSRTVCRRAEREVVSLSKVKEINPSILTYLNRLSDLLFVLARAENKKSKITDIPWKKD